MARGVNFLLYINTGTEETPLYTKVAGQRGGTFNRSTDTIDLTSKDNYGFKDEDYGIASWSIEADGLLVEDDAGYQALENAFDNKGIVLVRWETAGGSKYEGEAIITDFSNEAPYDDSATYSVTLNGKGQYTKSPGA
ncbi:phage major tail protein, TP901-1 family [Bacillus sp. MCCB 382]|uniref:phage major tail protein, TP901-1 family n=1 Tax=Bacillus sp. MCCB 382 TaxID=2860197 RepID=UPI001C57FC78|nr:phage major tail protein, TP901-1 family [Bacillus sp. MCCB 382]